MVIKNNTNYHRRSQRVTTAGICSTDDHGGSLYSRNREKEISFQAVFLAEKTVKRNPPNQEGVVTGGKEPRRTPFYAQ
jgi:hypothetical protein